MALQAYLGQRQMSLNSRVQHGIKGVHEDAEVVVQGHVSALQKALDDGEPVNKRRCKSHSAMGLDISGKDRICFGPKWTHPCTASVSVTG